MLGVVLWSDPQERKAVIWCEDHGDLAFFEDTAQAPENEITLDAGDLVTFEMHTRRDTRYAHNPQVVSGGAYRDLPRALGASAPQMPDADQTGGAQIIPFSARRSTPQQHQRRSAAS